MTHDHGPDHSHEHGHGPDHHRPAGDDPALDLTVPDAGRTQGSCVVVAPRGPDCSASASPARPCCTVPSLADEAVHRRPQARRTPRGGLRGWPATTTSTPRVATTPCTAWPTVQHASAYGLD
jgi:hypothetical protein